MAAPYESTVYQKQRANEVKRRTNDKTKVLMFHNHRIGYLTGKTKEHGCSTYHCILFIFTTEDDKDYKEFWGFDRKAWDVSYTEYYTCADYSFDLDMYKKILRKKILAAKLNYNIV